MHTINEAVNATSQVVERLITHTNHIDTALQSISNIAEQTNLLALNASIEAARAVNTAKDSLLLPMKFENLLNNLN